MRVQQVAAHALQAGAHRLPVVTSVLVYEQGQSACAREPGSCLKDCPTCHAILLEEAFHDPLQSLHLPTGQAGFEFLGRQCFP